MDIFFLIAGPLFVWAIAIYTLLTLDNQRVLLAREHIDVQLRQLHDLTVELVDLIRHYAHHEQATLRAITSEGEHIVDWTDAHQLGECETRLSNRGKCLLALVDAYPELKSSQSLLTLRQRLSQVESKLRSAKHHYNGAVNDLNKRIDRYPDNVIAHLFNYSRHLYIWPTPRAKKPLGEAHRGGLQNSHC